MDLPLLLRVLLTIAAIGVLMIVHEGGHYLAARAFGMRVAAFGIGIGPTLFQSKPKGSETEFRVGLLPFFAYVQIVGMNPYDTIDPDDESLFPHKGVFARFVTIAAGPIANYLFACVVAFGVALVGWPHVARTMIVGEVVADQAAYAGGMRVGDVIVEAEGRPVHGIVDVLEVTQPRAGQPTTYVVERNGARVPLTITPRPVAGHGLIGVKQLIQYEYLAEPPAKALRMALLWPIEKIAEQIQGIGEMFHRKTLEGLGGPVAMVTQGAETAKGGAPMFFLFVAFVSTGLALFNALPVPMLDGSRLLFLAYEAITRRRADPKIEAAIHSVGLFFLLGLMVFVTFKDIRRW